MTCFTKTNYLAGISNNEIAYGKKINNNHFIGFNLFYLNSGQMEVNTVALALAF